MKNILFLILLIGCFSLFLIIIALDHFYPPATHIESSFEFQTIHKESVMFGKQSEKDTILFTGYRNCSTVCANTLPILQKLAKQNQNARLQVIFLELTGSEEKKKFLEPKFFPDIKWVKVKAEQEPILLSLLQLDHFERDHHSSRVVLHRGGSDIIQVVDHFSESKYNDWSQNSKKSLSLF